MKKRQQKTRQDKDSKGKEAAKARGKDEPEEDTS
jgi:hypothetical protein